MVVVVVVAAVVVVVIAADALVAPRDFRLALRRAGRSRGALLPRGGRRRTGHGRGDPLRGGALLGGLGAPDARPAPARRGRVQRTAHAHRRAAGGRPVRAAPERHAPRGDRAGRRAGLEGGRRGVPVPGPRLPRYGRRRARRAHPPRVLPVLPPALPVASVSGGRQQKKPRTLRVARRPSTACSPGRPTTPRTGACACASGA